MVAGWIVFAILHLFNLISQLEIDDNGKDGIDRVSLVLSYFQNGLTILFESFATICVVSRSLDQYLRFSDVGDFVY